MVFDVLSRFGHDRGIRVRLCARCLNIIKKKNGHCGLYLELLSKLSFENKFLPVMLCLQHFLYNIFTAGFFLNKNFQRAKITYSMIKE